MLSLCLFWTHKFGLPKAALAAAWNLVEDMSPSADPNTLAYADEARLTASQYAGMNHTGNIVPNLTEGDVEVAGYAVAKHPDQVKDSIGYMAQRFNLYGDLSVEENLDFFADVFQVRGRERRERKQRLLQFARLTEFRKRRAAHLSGGMQKKLALACTLIHQPEVIFLDEPTTGVDPVSRREFWDILTELHLEGITIFVSTPYMDEAERCHRVGLLHEGRLLADGTPEGSRAAFFMVVTLDEYVQGASGQTHLPFHVKAHATPPESGSEKKED